MLSEQVRQRSFSVPILRRSRIRNARECSGRRRDKIGRQYRLPDHKNPYILIIDFPQQFSRCRGPLQANRSGGRQHYSDADGGYGIVECSLQRYEIARGKTNEGRLSLGCRVPAVEVVQSPKHHQNDHNENDSLSSHELPAKRSATTLAITCGKKMNMNTTIAENQRRKVLIKLGLQLHCFARQDL